MHYKYTLKMSFLLLLLFIFSVSCVSTTTIKAVDSKSEVNKDIKIYVDGKYAGDGEAQYSDQKTVYAAVPFFELKKEGCKTIKEKLDAETNWITSLGGAVLSGVGIGLLMSVAQRGGVKENTGLFIGGLGLSIAGIIPMFWGRKYVPVQEWEFQCVKTVD